ncbi:P22AR C-terminal domain-containing protein [[Pasteurella] aerogenes]
MTTLTFQNTTLSVINKNNHTFLTASDLGTALEYADPTKAIVKIYDRNADEFTAEMTALIELQTAGGKQQVRVFSLRGAHLIAMFARTKVAKEFRKWVLDILDKEVEKSNEQSAVKIEKLSKEHQTAIKDLVMGRVKNLPKEKQAEVIIKQWSALKNHFGKSYKEINDDQFTEAVSLIARLPLEGELITDDLKPQEQIYNAALSAKDIHDIVWLLLSAKYMHQLLGELEQPLEAIGSNFHPAVYSHHREYKHVINDSLPILKRLIEPFKESNPIEFERIKSRLKLN